jgi:hypothetical protein
VTPGTPAIIITKLNVAIDAVSILHISERTTVQKLLDEKGIEATVVELNIPPARRDRLQVMSQPRVTVLRWDAKPRQHQHGEQRPIDRGC